MKSFVKAYKDLEKDELYEILKLREKVFKIEQNSQYTDLDNLDKEAIHIFIKDDGIIKAYARLIEKDKNKKIGKLARVISRKKTYGRKICEIAIKTAFDDLKLNEIFIEAQVQAMGFYEKLGFEKTSKPYDYAGINHIDMILKKDY
ncbi:GNAT family N-acetyltransferase [Anaerococcus sp. AGMB00486]|uniref:GNAT family N-acetyltransferase n=1 Tax=Anaerococcus faecalis TaxID=2742993 RepID=A0ABX2NCI9_9FIRM|nr:GNAT family N-acetyltransferase [Anaerococcus faecalis]NVF12177.1 GNAT family N-acetyltransferase [Anaerococcus faecalis]